MQPKRPQGRFQPKGFITQQKARLQQQVLSNRIRKRFRHLSRRFKKQGIDCFRLYDWDIKDIRAVVDWYDGHLVVAEYERLQTGPDWLPQIAAAVAETLNVPKEKIHVKRRRTNTKGKPRYRKVSSGGKRFIVRERDLNFWVNMDDFLDTGLYSDHRDTRILIKKLAKRKDFLNLYAYTGAFTCAAVAGGAKTTVTVDRSETYLQWAKDNLELNGLFGPQHSLVQSDVGKFLERTYRGGKRFSLAFVDPPSFFRDRMRGVAFDINKDHPDLIRNVLRVMAPSSTVFFSTNHQRFEPHMEGLPVKGFSEITSQTIPEDYRNPQVHRLWKITVR